MARPFHSLLAILCQPVILFVVDLDVLAAGLVTMGYAGRRMVLLKIYSLLFVAIYCCLPFILD